MRLLASLLIVGACGVAFAQKQAEPKKETPVVEPLKGETKTINLFDGKTLDGWEGYEDLWSDW